MATTHGGLKIYVYLKNFTLNDPFYNINLNNQKVMTRKTRYSDNNNIGRPILHFFYKSNINLIILIMIHLNWFQV